MDEGLISRPRGLRVIRALHQEGPMSMRRFTEASGHVPQAAKVLRQELVELGLIEAVETRFHGNVAQLGIRLTPAGRRVAELWGEIENVVKRARKDGR